MSDIAELQSSIYSVLSQTFPDISIYDDVPETADTPYIVIGDDSVSDRGAKLCDIDEISVTIQIFSSYKGMKEVKELSSTIIGALKNLKVNCETAYLQYLRLESIDYDKDDEDMRSAEITLVFLVS